MAKIRGICLYIKYEKPHGSKKTDLLIRHLATQGYEHHHAVGGKIHENVVEMQRIAANGKISKTYSQKGEENACLQGIEFRGGEICT